MPELEESDSENGADSDSDADWEIIVLFCLYLI